jgi:hypothetical protein
MKLKKIEILFHVSMEYTEPDHSHTYEMTTTTPQTATEYGLSRMDDAEYEHQYRNTAAVAALDVGTPRPGGTSDTDATATATATATARAIQVWSFSQAAKQHAADVKQRRSPKSRTVYRMGVNTRVKNAFEQLKKKLDETREVHNLTPHLSENDFKLLKQGIENFRVKIIMDDSITFEELAQMRDANRIELTKANIQLQAAYGQYGPCSSAYIETRSKHADMMEWDSALTAELIRVRQTKGSTPSQQAQISPNDSGVALRNIIAPATIRCKFTSLHNLTMRIRNELVAFLTADARVNDRVEVVKQIKEACIAAAAAKKMKQ